LASILNLIILNLKEGIMAKKKTQSTKNRKIEKTAARMKCIDGVSECRPNEKPAGYCEFCGGRKLKPYFVFTE
jgi:hypothetical protein